MPKKDLNKDIKEFGVLRIENGELVPDYDIQSTKDYTHGVYGDAIHHYIKDTHYKKNTQWYVDRGIDQKLIRMGWVMHGHLEGQYALDDETFYNKYGIEKDKLLFNKDKWLTEQALKEMEE